MRLTQLSISNYKALKDVTIPLSRFGCLIGENNSGKSSFLQTLALFFSGSKLAISHYFDASEPIRIAITFEDICEADLARLAIEHRSRVAGIVKNGRLVLVRHYDIDGKSELRYNCLSPLDERFSVENIAALMKGQRAGQAFVEKVTQVFPELNGLIDINMNQDAMKMQIQAFIDSIPDDQKIPADLPLPTGIDRSIEPMLPTPIYIPAVKDLADDIKTTESTPFGKILAILLPAVEAKLPEAQILFETLNSKLNCIQQPDGTIVDARLDEVKLIELTVQKYLCETFANVLLRITIPPPELKTVFSSARININDGVDGLIDSKGDGLRRATVFSILRSYVELKDMFALSIAPSLEAQPSSPVEHQEVIPASPSYLLLFEEPELFLYPKAQHVLFDALRVFAKDNHVLVTTHSPMFFGPSATETFVKLCRISDKAISAKPFTVVRPINLIDINSKDQFQIICFENNNLAFFAETVVLVEGDSDYLLMPHIAKTLDPSWDVAKLPVHFARITGKGNIRRYRDFFSRFGVRVLVIADLDLLVNGFQHIEPDDALKTARNNLLVKVDEVIVPDRNGPSGKEAIEAHDSGELRGLWRRVKERQDELKAGECTQIEHDQTVEEFFAWQRKSDRLAVLMSSTDERILRLKWQLLEMLRTHDVYVLERGEIEQYYPENIIGVDKPSRAQDFCAKVTNREAILNCCQEQEFLRDGKQVREKEFILIFASIFSR
jgi:putative ATP-dependent endonuclease of OLD family